MLLIKLGGSVALNVEGLVKDLTNLNEPYVVIHGANQYLRDQYKRLHKEELKITSPSGYKSRYTTQEVLDDFLSIYCGLVNKRLVEKMQQQGINAIGLSGVDGKLFVAKRKEKIIGIVDGDTSGKPKVITDSYTGRVIRVNKDLIKLLIKNGYVPLISAPAISEQNEIVNIDNDRAAAILVVNLAITKMISLFEDPGLLEDCNDESTLIKEISFGDIDEHMKFANDNMKKKLLGAREAFANGLQELYFGDGRVEHPITNALAGNGTLIR